MKNISRNTQFIILSIVITFLVVSILGTGVLFIQAMSLAPISKSRDFVCMIILIFVVDSLGAIAGYFSIKKLIGKYGGQDYIDMEWLIRLDIILAQLAGVSMILPLAAVIYKKMLGSIVIVGTVFGMAVPLVVMLVVVCLREPYSQVRMSPKSKKENSEMAENKKLMKALRILAALMCILVFIGIISGNEIMR